MKIFETALKIKEQNALGNLRTKVFQEKKLGIKE